VLIGLLALMPFIFRHNIIFATSATTVITLVLIPIAFQVQQLRMLARTITKLDELLDLLRDAARALANGVEAVDARARADPNASVARRFIETAESL